MPVLCFLLLFSETDGDHGFLVLSSVASKLCNNVEIFENMLKIFVTMLKTFENMLMMVTMDF